MPVCDAAGVGVGWLEEWAVGVQCWHMAGDRRCFVHSLGRMGLIFVEETQLGTKCSASAGGFDSRLLFGFALSCPTLCLLRLWAPGSFYAVLYASCCGAVCYFFDGL